MPQVAMRQAGGLVTPAQPSLILPGDSRGFTPASLSGLVLWLDAASIGQADNTPVSQWEDRSGNGHNFTQPTTAAQGTYLASAPGNHPAVLLDGVDDYMTALGAWTAAFELFVVGRQVSTTGAQHILEAQTGVASQNYISGGDTGLSVVHNSVAWPSAVSAAAGLWHIYELQCTGTTANAWIDGNASTSVAATPFAGGTTLYLGRYNNSNVEFFNGYMQEVLLYSAALTASQQHAVRAYLSTKWGLASL